MGTIKKLRYFVYKIAHDFKPEYLIYLILLFYICKISYGKAFESYFWKDDWAMLWSSNFNPSDFYITTVGKNWILRTGIFMQPYVLYFHKIISDSSTWQLIGFFHKLINSLLFYIFIYSITKKKSSAYIGALLYTSYSGGIESYTWHTPTGLATSFILLAFSFYNKFLEKVKFKFFFLFLLFALLSFFSYVGRTAGLVMVMFFWGFLRLLRKDITSRDKKKITFAITSVTFIFALFTKYIVSTEKPIDGYFAVVVKNINYFFGIIGNLLKNPFVKVNELGYLADLSKSSVFLGYIFALIIFCLFIQYLKKRSLELMYIILFSGWIYLFYFTNWIYGGGGVTTVVGSGHRYMAAAGVGVVSLWVVCLSLIRSKNVSFFLVIFLLIANLKYSDHLMQLENKVRGRNLVEPIYVGLFEGMKDDGHVQVVVVDTPNYLKSFVVSGWYPYTYGYMKGLTETSQLPTVIPHWENALLWLCSDVEKRTEVQEREGFVNYQDQRSIDISHIYGWRLDENGKLTDETATLRNDYADCLNAKKETI